MTLESLPEIESLIPIKNLDKEAAVKRLEILKNRQQERMLGNLDALEKQKQMEEILKLNPQNVLVVCHAGVFRSGMVAEILNNRGYNATNTGTMESNTDIIESLNDFDAIIFMSKDREQDFKKLYGIEEFHIPVRHIGIAESANLHEESTKHIEVKAAEIKLDSLGFITKKEPL